MYIRALKSYQESREVQVSTAVSFADKHVQVRRDDPICVELELGSGAGARTYLGYLHTGLITTCPADYSHSRWA